MSIFAYLFDYSAKIQLVDAIDFAFVGTVGLGHCLKLCKYISNI